MQKTFALVAVVAFLARRWNILPREWGNPFRMVRAVAWELDEVDGGQADPLDEIRGYMRRHRDDLIEVAALDRPLSLADFEAAPGFLRQADEGTVPLIPAGRFRAAFRDGEALMRTLRGQGQARTEGGRDPKVSIKASRAVCEQGRVYCIRLMGDDKVDHRRA